MFRPALLPAGEGDSILVEYADDGGRPPHPRRRRDLAQRACRMDWLDVIPPDPEGTGSWSCSR